MFDLHGGLQIGPAEIAELAATPPPSSRSTIPVSMSLPGWLTPAQYQVLPARDIFLADVDHLQAASRIWPWGP